MITRKDIPASKKPNRIGLFSTLFFLSFGLVSAYPVGELQDHIDNSAFANVEKPGIGSKIIETIKSKVLPKSEPLTAKQIEEKLKQSTVRLDFTITTSGKVITEHCAGVYFKNITTRYDGKGAKQISGIAFPSGLLLHKLLTVGATLDKIEIHPAGATDKLITINPKEDFTKETKTNIYLHHAITEAKYNKDAPGYAKYEKQKNGAIAFLRIGSKTHRNKFKGKGIVPWHPNHMLCLSAREYRGDMSLNIYALTSTEKQPPETKYAQIGNDIALQNITKDGHILTILSSSPDDNTLTEDNDYNDGGPVVGCISDNTNKCKLLGFALSKRHFPELYNHESTATKVAFLYGPKLGSEPGKLERGAKAVGNVISEATGITGAAVGAIIGVTVSTPVFIGNAIAKEFHHSFPISNEKAVGIIGKSTKIGRKTANYAAKKSGQAITNAASKLNTEIGDRKENKNATLGAIQNHQSK